MKSLLYDIAAMAVVSILLYLYLEQEVAAIIIFGISLFSLRQKRRLFLKKPHDIISETNNKGTDT